MWMNCMGFRDVVFFLANIVRIFRCIPRHIVLTLLLSRLRLVLCLVCFPTSFSRRRRLCYPGELELRYKFDKGYGCRTH